MVTVLVPVAAVLLAVRVSVLVLVEEAGLNEGVTPLGRPDADKLTLALNPFCGVMVTVSVPVAPAVTLTLAGDADRLKVGTGAAFTVRLTVAVWLKLPELPVIVTVAAPVAAVPLAVSVSVLVVVAEVGLNEAVTPLGRPEADRLTPLLNPFTGVTMTVLVPLFP